MHQWCDLVLRKQSIPPGCGMCFARKKSGKLGPVLAGLYEVQCSTNVVQLVLQLAVACHSNQSWLIAAERSLLLMHRSGSSPVVQRCLALRACGQCKMGRVHGPCVGAEGCLSPWDDSDVLRE